ncbi:copper-binding transcription factor, partial [Ascosphaera aggregata]
MSHLTVPLSTQNPRRTSARPRKTTSLAKASTFTAPRRVVISADSDDEIEGLGGGQVDEIMSNNNSYDDIGNTSADRNGTALKAPVLSISRVLTRSHTDTRALENALKEGSRTVDLWERLERLRIDDKNVGIEGREKEQSASDAVSSKQCSSSDKKPMFHRHSDDIELSAITCSGGGTTTPSATSDYGSGSESDTYSSPTITKHANPPLSAVACRKIESHILLPLLRRKEVTPFYPLIRSLPPRIQSGEITTLRDLEKTLFGLSVNFAISKAVGRNVYTAFANYTIQCLHAVVPALCERELRSDGERAYSGLYFLDLVEQVRQYAAIVGHARVQRVAAAVKSMEKQLAQGGFEPDDELVLVNGIADSGRPAELVRRKKDGSMYCLSTGKPYTSNDTSSQLRNSQAEVRSRSSVGRPPMDEASSQQLRAARASIRASKYRNSKDAIVTRPQNQGIAQSKMAMKMGKASELGTKRALDTRLSLSTDEPPNDVSRSMARRKKGEAPMDVKALCRYCNKRFRRPCDLTKHMKTHTRPYKCPEPNCKYFTVGWPTEKERDRHVNDKHSKNPKLYHCEFGCGYQSKRESNCKQHMEKSHAYTYERTKRCSTVKKPPSFSAGSVAPMMTAPGGRMGAPSGTPMTPVSSGETTVSPSTPASGYASSTPAFNFSGLPTPAGASISGASTICEGHGSVLGFSSASTPITVAAGSPNPESNKGDGSLAGNSPYQACGHNENQRYDVLTHSNNQVNAVGFGEDGFSLFSNGDPFAAHESKSQDEAYQQSPFPGEQTNNASLSQL